MAERRFRLSAYHFAALALVAVAVVLALNLLRPVQFGEWGPAHATKTLGLATDDEGLLDNRSEMENALELARAVLNGETTKAEAKS